MFSSRGLLLLLLWLHCWLAFPSRFGKIYAESGFEYDDGPLGPQNWGNLRDEWRACGLGRQQSPISVDTSCLVDDIGPDGISFDYVIGTAHLITDDHSLEIEWEEGGGGVRWDNLEYQLLNVHFHTPSEHTVDKYRFPFETHIVHQSSNNTLLVVSLLHKRGEEDEVIADLFGEFANLTESANTEHATANVSLSGFNLSDDDAYYHYLGSLTTPPCAEGVQWIIIQTTRTISTEQVDEIREANMGLNARPLQALNGRTVYKKGNCVQEMVVQSRYNHWSI